MRKSVLFVAVVAAGVVGVWRWQGEPAASGKQLLVDRLWLDHIPRNERDTIQVFVATSEDATGAFAAASQWRGRFEAFRYEVQGGELRVVYPQTGERETVRVKAKRCTDNGMDFCLELDGASHGAKKYYSREGWEIDRAADRHALEARVEALRAQLVADPGH